MSNSLLIGFILFVVFGYLEKTLSMGYVVSAVLLVYTLLSPSRQSLFSANTLAQISLCGLHFALSDLSRFPVLQSIHLPDDSVLFQFYERQRLAGLMFLVLVYLFTRERTNDDVVFGPHEQRLRKYLLKHDPGMLHKVDSLLTKYRGREDFLMEKLQKKYESDAYPSSPEKNKRKSITSPLQNSPTLQEQELLRQQQLEYDQYMLQQQKEQEKQRQSAHVQYELQQQQLFEQQNQLHSHTQQNFSKYDHSNVCDSDSSSDEGGPPLHEESDAAVYDEGEDFSGPFSRRDRRLTPELPQEHRGGMRSSLSSDPLHGTGPDRYGYNSDGVDDFNDHHQHDENEFTEEQWRQELAEQQWRQEQRLEQDRYERAEWARQRARDQLRQQQEARSRFSY